MLNPDYRDILSGFTDEGVEFLLVGAYALAAHGLPRATGDMDLWVRASAENATRVWRALGKFGAPLDQVTESDFAEPGIVFQIGVAPCRVDVLTTIDGVTFDDAWPDRVTVSIGDLSVPVLSRPHLIRNKRASARPQDLADVSRLEALTEESDGEAGHDKGQD